MVRKRIRICEYIREMCTKFNQCVTTIFYLSETCANRQLGKPVNNDWNLDFITYLSPYRDKDAKSADKRLKVTGSIRLC